MDGGRFAKLVEWERGSLGGIMVMGVLEGSVARH
jgi:hypothetical protein